MTRLTLTSTTALMLGLSLSPAHAQDSTFPCALPDGTTIETAQDLADVLAQEASVAALMSNDDPAICGPAALTEARVLMPDQPADAAAPADPEAATSEETDATVEAADEPVDADDVAAPESAPAETPDAEVDDEVEEAPAVAEEAPVAEEPVATEEAPVAEEPAATEEPVVTEEPAAAEEPAPVTDVAPEAEADPQPAGEPAAAAETDTPDMATDPDDAPAVDAVTDPAVDDAASDPQSETDAQPQATDEVTDESAPTTQTAPDESEIEAETSAETSTPPADEDADLGAQIEAETQAETSSPPELTEEERAARDARRAERAAARQQSEAATADASDAEVVTEEVEADDVRAADEDFDTQVLSDTATSDDDDDGLSRFEQAILLGLGAAAVGAVLNNGDQVVSNSGDRVIVERDGELRVLKDDNTLLRQAGTQVATQTFDDGSTLTTVTRDDGSFVTTIRAADGTVLRRTLTRVDGTQVNLINDLEQVAPIEVSELPALQQRTDTQLSNASDEALRAALTADLLAQTGRFYSLEQVRDVQQVRALAPQIELDTITFASGSAAIQPSQAEELSDLGRAIVQIVQDDPSAIFLIEGHTDAVGDAAYNLGLSDRRAETVALALTQYFGVPPENLVTQGYGEAYLKVQTLQDERENRRAAVRNITDLLRDS
ncbi:OmpA family protein [Loktanella sp. SALINAS62]|uniref:OmpA family protein n=1 Tax=Loktanella sp. SALINAS62 TaxID=2706124 RepID=UPI001B8D10C5|nr:OmpA family protein [Loktanella sp. SALINAS62]MBS1301573.1 OmpA family protein [Loktanella sp. SALINAS62]